MLDKEDRWTDQQTYLPVEMQFYIFMFLGLLDVMTYTKKNLHFCNLKKTHYRRTDRLSYRDARTHLNTPALGADTIAANTISRQALAVAGRIVNQQYD